MVQALCPKSRFSTHHKLEAHTDIYNLTKNAKVNLCIIRFNVAAMGRLWNFKNLGKQYNDIKCNIKLSKKHVHYRVTFICS